MKDWPACPPAQSLMRQFAIPITIPEGSIFLLPFLKVLFFCYHSWRLKLLSSFRLELDPTTAHAVHISHIWFIAWLLASFLFGRFGFFIPGWSNQEFYGILETILKTWRQAKTVHECCGETLPTATTILEGCGFVGRWCCRFTPGQKSGPGGGHWTKGWYNSKSPRDSQAIRMHYK